MRTVLYGTRLSHKSTFNDRNHSVNFQDLKLSKKILTAKYFAKYSTEGTFSSRLCKNIPQQKIADILRISRHTLTLKHGAFCTGALQLDWTSNTSRQKINFPTNRKGYDNSETTVGKLSAGRIQICLVQFYKSHFWPLFQNNFPNNAQTKIDQSDLDSPRRIL